MGMAGETLTEAEALDALSHLDTHGPGDPIETAEGPESPPEEAPPW
jgi:hypothetical protein